MVESVQRLLDQVRSESLDQLLRRHRNAIAPPGPLFLPQLDVVLGSTGSLSPGSVYELVGGPKSGKTQFLYFLALTTILPHEWVVQLEEPRLRQQVIELGGRDRSVIVVSLDFNIRRVVQLLRSHIEGRLDDKRITSRDVEEQIDLLIRDSLRKIHVFQPTSSPLLIECLQSIPQYARDALDDRFVLFLIDGLGQFYWPDRALLETSNARDRPTVSTAYGIKTHLIPALETIQKQVELVTFVTNWDMPSKESNPTYSDPHLLTTWWTSSMFKIERLNFTRAPIGQFPHGHSLSDALRDDEKWRSKIVDKGAVYIRRHLARSDVPSVELSIQEWSVGESGD